MQFAEQLYNMQQFQCGTFKYNIDDCYDCIYQRFITHTLIGSKAQNIAKTILHQEFPQLLILYTSMPQDVYKGIDLIIFKDDIQICGIQVKPESYGRHSNNPFIIILNYENQQITNLQQVVFKIDCALTKSNCDKD